MKLKNLFNKIAQGQVRFKPFSAGDWAGWAGASKFRSGDEPWIAAADVDGVEFILIAGGEGLSLVWLKDDGVGDVEEGEYLLDLTVDRAAQAVRVFRSLLAVCADVADLADLGFIAVR